MKLYIDFDGVILNTIEVSYKKIKEQYGENATAEDSSKFYRSIDWKNFINECIPINDSINNIQKIIDTKLYDVTVLTHVLSKHEDEEKRKFLNEKIPELNYIPVTKPNPKWDAVDCKNAILVDDYSENLKEWQAHGGIPIKFSLKDKEYEFITIKSLDELIPLYQTLSNQSGKSLEKAKKKFSL